jgi:hypothetical protein
LDKTRIFPGQHILSQILSLSSRDSLAGVFKSTKADKWYKSIKAWDQYVTMMFCVLSGCSSLREIVMGLEAFGTKLNHLGLEKVPPRSTLADANKMRSSEIFGKIYYELVRRYRLKLSDSSLSPTLLSKLFVVDATVFSLFKAILKGPGRNPVNGKRKGGIKKHTMLSGSSLMPVLIKFTAAAASDQHIIPEIKLPPGSFITFDKGYTNYQWYAAMTIQGVYFITRQKEDAVYTSISEAILPDTVPSQVLKDEIIECTYKDKDGKEVSFKMRRIAWWDEKSQRAYEFITNNFELDAATIAGIYQYRWQIELFFKKLKQNFGLNYFVGDNQNAIEIQIWCALISVLLLSAIHSSNKSKIAFSNVVTLLRIHLAGYISISELLRLHNKKRERGRRPTPVHSDLFAQT